MSISDNPQNNQQEHTGHTLESGVTPFAMVQRPARLYIGTHLKPSAFIVYVCIVDHSNPGTKVSFPGVDTIMRETGLGKNTVINSIRDLVAHELLTLRKIRTPHGYDRNEYRVVGTFQPGPKNKPSPTQKVNPNKNQVNNNQSASKIRDRKGSGKSTSPASPPVNYGLREDADGEYDALTPEGDAQEGE